MEAALAQSHRRCYLSRSLVGLVAVRLAVLVVERGLGHGLVLRLVEVLDQHRCVHYSIATEILVVMKGQLGAEVRVRKAEVLGRSLVAACRSLGPRHGQPRHRDFVLRDVEAMLVRSSFGV